MNMKFLDDSRVPDHPYPELREVLNIFVDEIQAELGENLDWHISCWFDCFRRL